MEENILGSATFFENQKKLIKERPLVETNYIRWYSLIKKDVESVGRDLPVLELGSGASFFKDCYSNTITSDVVEGVADRVVDARSLPFENCSLAGICMTHVFHHIPDVDLFFQEAERVLVSGGVISMIDICNTPLAKLLFSSQMHPEPFDDKVENWSFPEGNNMLASNQALAHIVFKRDIAEFNRKYPGLVLEVYERLPSFSYLLSGGVAKKPLIPVGLSRLVISLEPLTVAFNFLTSLHVHIRVRKVS